MPGLNIFAEYEHEQDYGVKTGYRMSWYQYQKEKLLLNIVIQTGAKMTEVVGLHGDQLKIRIQAQPIEGQANEALIILMAKLFDVPKRQVVIKRGLHSRKKVLVIENSKIDPNMVLVV